MRTIVEVDSRRRISFAKVIKDIKPGDVFWVEKGSDGVIVLRPMKILPAAALDAPGR